MANLAKKAAVGGAKLLAYADHRRTKAEIIARAPARSRYAMTGSCYQASPKDLRALAAIRQADARFHRGRRATSSL